MDLYLINVPGFAEVRVCVRAAKHHTHQHHLPPWIRSFDLFRHRRVAIFSWGVTISSSSGFVVEGVFREIHSFKVVDPVLFVFGSYVLYSRDL